VTADVNHPVVDPGQYFSSKTARVLSVTVPMHPGKSWNLRKEFSRPGKSLKITVVMEKSWNSANRSWNFLTEE